MSLGQLSEDGKKVVLKGEFLWVYDEHMRLLMKVKRSPNRLYKVILEESSDTCLMAQTEEESWLWHARLGHVNFQALTLMARAEMVYGLPMLIHTKANCEGFLMSKQVRKTFPTHLNFIAKQVLELIHCDICGPITPETPAGNRYFLLFVDDCSRKMWVYMLKTKGEALGVFKGFKQMSENKTEKKIKILRSDRCGEFCLMEFTKFCEQTGIVRHYTAPYTPQQNGV